MDLVTNNRLDQFPILAPMILFNGHINDLRLKGFIKGSNRPIL